MTFKVHTQKGVLVKVMPQVPLLFLPSDLPCEDPWRTKGSLENLSLTYTWGVSNLESREDDLPHPGPLPSRVEALGRFLLISLTCGFSPLISL